MAIAFWFWLLMAIWLINIIFGVRVWPLYERYVGGIFGWLIVAMLGWTVFGSMVHTLVH